MTVGSTPSRQADVAENYKDFLAAFQQIAFGEDAYSQGALNGQFFLSRIYEWEPKFRETIADVLAFHGAVHHKLFWMREISGYAERRGATIRTSEICDGHFGGKLAEKSAETYYRLALDLHGDCARALFNLGSLLGDLGELDAAIVNMDRAATVQKYYLPYAHFHAARLLDAAGRDVEARERWRAAAATGHLFGQLHHKLALALRRHGDTARAIEEMDRCLDCTHYYAPEFTELRLPLPEFGKIQPVVIAGEAVTEPTSTAPRPLWRRIAGRLRRAMAGVRG